MKKLFVILVAVLFVATSAFAINVKENTEAFNPGATTTDHEEVVATVYNSTGEALANGDVVAYNLSSDDGRSVTKTNIAGQKVAGVITETIAAGGWGKMLVYGYHSAVKCYGANGYDLTAGYPLYAYGHAGTHSTNTTTTYNGYAGLGIAYIGTTSMTSGGPDVSPFGVALDTFTAAGSASTIEAFIDCL